MLPRVDEMEVIMLIPQAKMQNAFEKSWVALQYKELLGPQNDEIDSYDDIDILNEEIPGMSHSLIG